MVLVLVAKCLDRTNWSITGADFEFNEKILFCTIPIAIGYRLANYCRHLFYLFFFIEYVGFDELIINTFPK